jgi:hypothetical protein
MDIWSIAFLIVGLAAGYFIYDFNLRKRKALYEMIGAIKKGHIVAFLETDKSESYVTIEKVYKNLGIAKDGSIVILPENSIKPCLNFGGVRIVHGDLYRSIGSCKDLRDWVGGLKKEYNLMDDEIAAISQEVEKNPTSKMIVFYKAILEGKERARVPVRDENGEIKTDKDGNIEYSDLAVKDMKDIDLDSIKIKLKIFQGVPATVKNWIYTGVNRISLNAMLREYVYQRDLEKKKAPWDVVAIAVAILIILLGLYFLLPKILPFFIPVATSPSAITGVQSPNLIPGLV